MSPQEAAKRFGMLEKLINSQLPAFINERIAMSAAGMISNRVIHERKNFLGGGFSSYSTKPIFTSGKTEKSKRVWTTLAGSRAKRRQLDWITIKAQGKNVHLFKVPGGYKEIRQIEGLQTQAKDFFFTGQMWRGFGVKRRQKTRSEIVVTLGGRNLQSQKLIDENSRREGINIVNISQSELNSLARMVDKELQRYIKKVGL